MPRLTNAGGVTVTVDDETAKRLLVSADWSNVQESKPVAKKVAAPKSEQK